MGHFKRLSSDFWLPRERHMETSGGQFPLFGNSSWETKGDQQETTKGAEKMVVGGDCVVSVCAMWHFLLPIIWKRFGNNPGFGG